MPRVFGASALHVSEVDAIVEHDEELPALPQRATGDVDRVIARRVATLVPDHTCFQIGVGGPPQAVSPTCGGGKCDDRDAHDNALAENGIALFKTEAIGRSSPFPTGPLRIIDDVEYATTEWVDWFNNRRLHSVLDYVPPEEYEAAYYAQTRESQPATPQP